MAAGWALLVPRLVRCRWDYFVRYLMGAEPPQGYELKPPGRTAQAAGGPSADDEEPFQPQESAATRSAILLNPRLTTLRDVAEKGDEWHLNKSNRVAAGLPVAG